MRTREEVERDITGVQELLAAEDDIVRGATQRLAQLHFELANLEPPFKVGDKVRFGSSSMRTETVVAVGLVGTDWYVRTDCDDDGDVFLASKYRRVA